MRRQAIQYLAGRRAISELAALFYSTELEYPAKVFVAARLMAMRNPSTPVYALLHPECGWRGDVDGDLLNRCVADPVLQAAAAEESRPASARTPHDLAPTIPLVVLLDTDFSNGGGGDGTWDFSDFGDFGGGGDFGDFDGGDFEVG